MKGRIQASDPSIKGFNVGINCGEVAGQTILHCHIHLIPRRKGDVENPAGGIRHLIPGKGLYAVKENL
jgi:diadenosine tetraphosphate (Ap4A) HIT family hydrolase